MEVEIHIIEKKYYPGGDPDSLEKWKVLKAGLIDVLKNSSSKERKFLRCNVTRMYPELPDLRCVRAVVKAEELEVLPESSL